MAKGTGGTRSVGSGSAASTRTSGSSSSLSKVQTEERMGISERQFFNVTGSKYGHYLSSYEEQLGILNRLPDSATLHTGHKAGEAKEYLKKIIKIHKG